MMISIVAAILGWLLCLSSPAGAVVAPNPPAGPDQAAAPQNPEDEAAQLSRALRQEVPHAIFDSDQRAQEWVARAQAMVNSTGFRIERPQLLVVVDRNPRVQQLRLILAQPDGPWKDLGGSRVSTGQLGRPDHFLTPTGVFLHNAQILDWRAEGTKNEHGIRGLGPAGMRVWDFGWQNALRGWDGEDKVSRMRLLLHATDPKYLERRLGHVASDGCVRIPIAMNRFLDEHGVLDRDYERAARTNVRFAKLLLSDRQPTPLAGDAMVIVDSSENSGGPG